MKNTLRNIIFVTVSVFLIGMISACSNSFSNEILNPGSENQNNQDNWNNQNLGTTTVRMFVPDYAAMAEKSESRAIAPQTAYVQLSGFNSVSQNWNVFQRIEFSSAVKTPVENSPENFPGNIFTITFDKVVAKAYQAGELKIELLNSAGSVVTSGTNATIVNVQYGGNASTTFYTVPENFVSNDSNLSKGEMKFMRYIMKANTHYTLHLDVEGSSYPDVVIFNEDGTFAEYISVDAAESSRIEFTENFQTVKYIGVWADDGVAVSNYKLNLYTDLTDFTFKDSSIGFWGGETYKVNLTPVPADSYLGKATYISSNPDITVSEDGMISGNSEAEGTITVSYNGISHSIAVNVYETATELKGVLSGEKLHWTKENSPYKVTGDVLVEENDQLVIEPGVKVYFVGNNYIKMNGSIYAVGTKEEPITITKAASYNGTWDGLRIGGGSLNTTDTYTYNSGNILKYVNFSYAGSPATLSSSVFVDHCNFTDCFNYVSVGHGSVLINNNFENGICIESDGNILTNNRIINKFSMGWSGEFTASNNTFENCYFYLEGGNLKSFVNNIFKSGTFNLGSDYYDCLRFQNNNFENFTGIILNITGSHDRYKTIDFTGNYWGETQTAELIANEATGEKNVNFIKDYRDDFNLTEVDYSGWQRESIEGAGYQGDGFIAFDFTVNGYNWNNGGTYPESTSPELSITVTPAYYSNPITQIRIAQGYENLKTADWVAYIKENSFIADLDSLENEFAPIYVQLMDSEGNVSSSICHKVPYDAPRITCSINDGVIFNNPSDEMQWTWTFDDYSLISEYEILIDGINVRSDVSHSGWDEIPLTRTDNYIGLPYMASGEHTVQIKVWDIGRNLTEKEITFIINNSHNNASSLADVSWSTTTGQFIKDEKTAYLWHFDGDTQEVDGEDYATLGKDGDKSGSYPDFAKVVEGGINGAASRVYGGYNEIPLNSNSTAFTVEYWQKGETWYVEIEKSGLLKIRDHRASMSTYAAESILYYSIDDSSVNEKGLWYSETNKKPDKDWHYFCHVFADTYMAVYKDGQLMSYRTFSKVKLNTEGNTNNLFINFGEYEDTSYDELRISTCVRTPDEIKAYYDVAAPLYDSGN